MYLLGSSKKLSETNSLVKNGKCNDTITGNGNCQCQTGWTSNNCDSCADNYFGETCQPCKCSLEHSICDDGLEGEFPVNFQ